MIKKSTVTTIPSNVSHSQGMKITSPSMYSYSQEGRLQSLITGTTIFLPHDSYRIFGENISISHYHLNGKAEYKLLAKKGFGNLLTHDFELFGNITAENLHNVTIKTEKAFFIGKVQEIQAETLVTVDMEKHRLVAHSAVVKLQEQTISAHNAELTLFAKE